MDTFRMTRVKTECDLDPTCYDYPSYAVWEWILGIVIIATVIYFGNQKIKR